MSVKTSLVRCITHNVLAGAVLAGLFMFLALEAPKESVQRPHAAGSLAWVMEQHGCEAEYEDPTAVILSEKDGTTYVSRKPVMVKWAVEQEYYGVAHGLDVRAFCG